MMQIEFYNVKPVAEAAVQNAITVFMPIYEGMDDIDRELFRNAILNTPPGEYFQKGIDEALKNYLLRGSSAIPSLCMVVDDYMDAAFHYGCIQGQKEFVRRVILDVFIRDSMDLESPRFKFCINLLMHNIYPHRGVFWKLQRSDDVWDEVAMRDIVAAWHLWASQVAKRIAEFLLKVVAAA